MAICANAVQTADGLVVVLDPSQQDLGTCQYVLQTGTEAAYGSLTSMSPADAATYAMLCASVWAVAWGIRQAVHSLFLGERNVEEN